MGHGRLAGWHSSTYVLVLAIGILLAPLSDAAPARPVAGQPATVSLSDEWAFAGSQAVNQSTTQGIWTVTEAGSYAWTDLLSERSTGPWGVSLQIDRGMTTSFQYGLCSPSCASAAYQLTVTIAAREWSVEFLNLSTQAPLTVGSTPQTGVGVENVSVVSNATLNTVSMLRGSSTPAMSEVDTALSSAGFSLKFGSPLGLFPSSPGPLASWRSSGTAQASGGWTHSLTSDLQGGSVPSSSSSQKTNLPASIALSMAGATAGPVGLVAGPTTSSLALNLNESFRLLDGFVFDPTASSLFLPQSAPGSNTGLAENGSLLDYASSESPHLGLLASESWFQPTVAAPRGAAAAPVGGGPSAFEPASWPVQAQTESPSVAWSVFNALGFVKTQPVVTQPGVTPGLAVSGTSSSYLIVGAGLVGLAVVLVLRRRRGEEMIAEAPPMRSDMPPGQGQASRAEMRSTEPSPGRDPFDDLL
jgi:hypothetical protein